MYRQGSRKEDTVENEMDQAPTLRVLTFNKPVLSLHQDTMPVLQGIQTIHGVYNSVA